MKSTVKRLQDNWASGLALFRQQNLRKVRIYFGERIGFYFAWLEYIIYWLVMPSVLGVACYLLTFILEDLHDKNLNFSWSELVIFIFSLFLSMATSLINLFWIRKQHRFSWQWGMTYIAEV